MNCYKKIDVLQSQKISTKHIVNNIMKYLYTRVQPVSLQNKTSVNSSMHLFVIDIFFPFHLPQLYTTKTVTSLI